MLTEAVEFALPRLLDLLPLPLPLLNSALSIVLVASQALELLDMTLQLSDIELVSARLLLNGILLSNALNVFLRVFIAVLSVRTSSLLESSLHSLS